MAKKKNRKSDTGWSTKLRGVTFAFAGKLIILQKSYAIEMLRIYGGAFSEKLDESVDYLVVGQGSGKAIAQKKQRAAKLNASTEATIQLIDESEFHELLLPTPEEAIEMFTSPRGRKAWDKLRTNVEPFLVDLSGTDFRGAEFYYYGAFFQCNDFTGASLVRIRSEGTKLAGSIFKNADLSDAELPRIDARNCDFTGAKMTEGNFPKSNFSKSVFVRANLSGSRFPKASFKGADLRKADLRDTDLESADFTGARIDGADFSGAMLNGARISTLDASKANGLVTDRWKKKKAGPQVKKLLQAAGKASKLSTSATLMIDGGRVEMYFQVEAKIYGSFTSRRFAKRPAKRPAEPRQFYESTGYNVPPRSLESVWMSEVSRFDGELVLESITCKCSKSPIKGKELRDVAIAAWCESFGFELPSPDELKATKKRQSSAKSESRKEMLAELRGGPAGIKTKNSERIPSRR